MFGKTLVRYQGQLYEVDAEGRIHLDVKRSGGGMPEKKAAPAQGEGHVWSGTRRKDRPDKWSPRQLEVIESPLGRRLVVTAPPGSGKTATACCRVARLIEELGGDAHRICVISFTRAAVDEFRARIGLYLANPEQAYGIRITTLDSLAWLLHSGFDEGAKLTGSFEDNIKAALMLLQENELLKEEIGSIRHLVVDEAQDFLGIRAELVLGIVATLHAEAGLTVLGDEAQSIYGFSVEEADGDEDGDHLIQLIRDRVEPKPDERELTDIFRAETESLAKLITDARKIVLKDEAATPKAVSDLMEMIRGHAQGETEGLSPEVPHSSVILFRNRVDVLSAAFSEGAPPARLRLSGHSQIINPVLAICLFDFSGPRLSRAEFEKRWSERLPNGGDPASVWDALVRLAGDGRGAVETGRLRFALRRKGLPPALATPDIGARGPLLSTIHAFKGREAAEVHLMLPRAPKKDSDTLGEEARVLYVGASRAIGQLKVGEAKAHYGSGTERGRAYLGIKGYGSARVEIGREGDVDAEGMVGTVVCPTEEEGRRIHSRLAMLRADQGVDITANFLTTRQKRYLLKAVPEGQPLGALSRQVSVEVWKIIERVVGRNRRPGSTMDKGGLKVLGARTLVLLPDDPALETLHEPWRESGFVLAPVVVGFPYSNSSYWKKHG